MLSDRIRALQEDLLQATERFLYEESLSPDLKQAFIDTPRHCFAPRFTDGRPGLWSDVSSELLSQHLDALYADRPYAIYKDENGDVISTLSQPSLVLYMIHLLKLSSGLTVLELGGGSGWNAALMGRLVEPTGHIYSVEVISALLPNAQRALNQLGINNVSLINGDASEGITDRAPFDRGVFTASSWDLPNAFFEQIKEDGLLLFVFQIEPNTDLLTVLRKRGATFISELHFPCRFVPVTGDLQQHSSHPARFEEVAFHKWMKSNGTTFEDLDLMIYRSGGKTPKSHSNVHRFERCQCVFEWAIPSTST